MWCVWLSSVARSCATRNANNKDNVWEPFIPARINRPPPSETISHVTRVPDHQTRLAGTTGLPAVSDEGPCEKVYFYIGWRSRAEEFGIPPRSESHRWEDSWSDGTGHRGDPRNETSEPALRTPSTEVEATPRRGRGSS